jgi:hypothetical protein
MWNHLVAVETAVMKENRFKAKQIKGTWNVECPLCEVNIASIMVGPEDMARDHSATCSGFGRAYSAMLYRMRYLCANVSDAVVRSPRAHL